jgi:hypothetical protein
MPNKYRKLTYEEMGYNKVLDKSRWVLGPNRARLTSARVRKIIIEQLNIICIFV